MATALKSEPVQNPERLPVIDVAKGLLMLLVVMGHAIQFVGYMGGAGFWNDPLFILIYMFHMPLFMAFSGYLSPQRLIGWGDMAKRAKTLIYPMLVFAVLVAVLRGGYKRDLGSIPHEAWDGFLNIYWFLWATLLCYGAVGLAERAGRAAVMVYVAAFVVIVMCRETWVVLPPVALVLPFFVLARWGRRSGWLALGGTHQNTSWAWLAVLLLGVALAFYVWGTDVYIYNNQINVLDYPWQIGVMYVAGGVSAIFWGWCILALARRCLTTAVGAWLGLVGKRTLEIYLVQGVVFTFIGAVLRKLGDWSAAAAPVKWLLSALFTLMVLAVIVPLIDYSTRSKTLSRLVWGR